MSAQENLNPHQFRLTRTLPDGTVKAHAMKFKRPRDAAQAAAYALADNGVASRKDATSFAAKLQAAKLGEPVAHESGYSFTISKDT
jgi:hypothetical protein